MSTNRTLRALAELEAHENNVTYAEIVAAEVGVNPFRVLVHYDIRTAWREYRNNLRLEGSRRRNIASFETGGPPPF